MPIYSLNFSNQKYNSSMRDGNEALLIGVTSCLPDNNRVQILEMCEASSKISKLAEVPEKYPCTKIQWIPSHN
jgi:hypothetical protein